MAAWSCVSDRPLLRDLDGAYMGSRSLTRGGCLRFCEAGGFLFAGVQAGRHCFCSDASV